VKTKKQLCDREREHNSPLFRNTQADLHICIVFMKLVLYISSMLPRYLANILLVISERLFSHKISTTQCKL